MKAHSLLLRQVHPKFFSEKKLSSQAFVPFPKDQGLLSVYDNDMISAEQSFVHYTGNLKFDSVGVWGVTNNEVINEGLASKSDPLPNSPAHALIDFTTISSNAYRPIAKRLRDYALEHGCLYLKSQ